MDAETRARRAADLEDIVEDRRCAVARLSPTGGDVERSKAFEESLSGVDGEGRNSVCRRVCRDTNFLGGSGAAAALGCFEADAASSKKTALGGADGVGPSFALA